MSASTKLSTAVKAICYLTDSYPQPKTSAEISSYTGINASKLRKILSMLVKNNIVESAYGMSGGFALKKDPAMLHLQEVYCAIEDRKAFYLDVKKDLTNQNIDQKKLNSYFLNLFSDIQVDIENKMKKITIDSIIQNINNPRNKNKKLWNIYRS
jgi:Rrf2 family protein